MHQPLEGKELTTVPPRSATEASFRYLSNVFEHRARKLPRDLVKQRVEELFKTLCLEVEPTIGLEIGAHEAGFSRWLKSEAPGARVVAYEANPYVYEKYVDDVTASGVEYLHLAVSDVKGTVHLGIPRELLNTEVGRRFGKPRTSRMASIAQHRYAEETEMVDVPSVPLDDHLVVNADDVIVAWIDVEGASGPVLSSGRDVLSRASLVYIEVEREQVWDGQWLDVDVAEFLAGCGLVPIVRDTQRPHQYNLVFANAELAADPSVARRCNAVFRRDPAR